MSRGSNYQRVKAPQISINNVDTLTQSGTHTRDGSSRGDRRGDGASPAPTDNPQPSPPVSSESKAPKLNLSKVPYNQLLQKMENHFMVLWSKDDLTDDVLPHLNYISECSRLYSGKNGPEMQGICQNMLKHGVVELFGKIWEQNFEQFSAEEENKLAYGNMKFIMFPLRNCAHESADICQRILETELYKDLFLKYLDSNKFSPQSKRSASKQHLTRGIMAISHNLLQNVDAREPIRKIGGVEILMKFRDSYTNLIKIKTEILLAYLIDEEQNEQINSTGGTFAYLVKVLTDCMANGDHHSKTFGGYDAVEILRALDKLSVTDRNKTQITANGALPLLTRLLEKEGNTDEERVTAAGVLWSLAFTSKRKILNEPGCIDGLRKLAVDKSSDEARFAAEGALWVLKVDGAATICPDDDDEDMRDDLFKEQKKRDRKQATPDLTGKILKFASKNASPSTVSTPVFGFGKQNTVERNNDSTSGKQKHVFISYQWGSQETILLVRDRLKSQGYNVWMDVDNISGSILEAMARAVEEASVVVVCLSQKYKESPNCRTEGEYAYRLGKTIVPLQLERRYQPDGWLGALIGNKLYFDISDEQRLEKNYPSFVRELGNMEAGQAGLVAPAITATQSQAKSASDGRSSHASVERPLPQGSSGPSSTSNQLLVLQGWNQRQVKEWFSQHGLDSIASRFSDFDGEMIMGLHNIMKDAPEYFYKTLKEEYSFTLKDSVKFSLAFKKL